MKLAALCLLATSLGCATAQPLVISPQERQSFDDLVRDARAAGAAEGPAAAKQRLIDAESEFEYAQHLPLYPERARLLIDKARADAGLACELARADAQARLAAKAEARREILVGTDSP